MTGERIMATPEDFRIEEIRRVTLNGRPVKLFTAYKRSGSAFVFAGAFSAPVKTANKDLWKIVAAEN